MSIKSPLNRQLGTQFDSVFDVVKSNPMYDKSGGKIPSLDLNFAKSKSLRDSRSTKNLINFTRASSGTYVGSDGLIKTTPVNLLTYSEQFDQWSKGSATVITANAVAAFDGTFTADRVYFPSSGTRYIAKSAYLYTGKTYTFSIWAKAVTPGTNNEFLPKINSPTARFPDANFVATSEWKRFIFTFTHTDPDASTSVLPLNINLNIVDVYLWGAQVEEGSTVNTYIPTTSTISGAPRFDHDPVTGESLGLLIEESRTNQLLYSEQFDNIAWTKSLVTVTSNAIVAPDGVTTADKLTATNTANESRHIRQDSSIVSNKSYTQSVFAKAGEITVLQIAPSTKFTNDFQNFDLSTGQLGSGGSGSATIEPYPNGWYRCSMTRDSVGSNGQGRMLFAIVESATSGRAESFQADAGDGLYLWGSQLETGSSTSYIPTSGSAVTRSPDIATIESNKFAKTNLLTYSERIDQYSEIQILPFMLYQMPQPAPMVLNSRFTCVGKY